MLFVSTRENLSNEDVIGPTSYHDLDIRGQIEIRENRVELDLAAVKQRISNQRILILVHGYNNELEDITRA